MLWLKVMSNIPVGQIAFGEEAGKGIVHHERWLGPYGDETAAIKQGELHAAVPYHTVHLLKEVAIFKATTIVELQPTPEPPVVPAAAMSSVAPTAFQAAKPAEAAKPTEPTKPADVPTSC